MEARFMGIVKVEKESMMGVRYELKTKFSNDIVYLRKWFELYPDAEHIILDKNDIKNFENLKEFLEVFEDLTPVLTHEHFIARKLYEKFAKED